MHTTLKQFFDIFIILMHVPTYIYLLWSKKLKNQFAVDRVCDKNNIYTYLVMGFVIYIYIIFVCVCVCVCVYNICTSRGDDSAGGQREAGPIGVCDGIIIYYTIVDCMSDFFDFFSHSLVLVFPKLGILCAYIILPIHSIYG